MSTSPDGSQVVLTQFPTSGSLSTFGLMPSKIKSLALTHNIPSWPTDALTGCSALESITAFGEELETPIFQVVRAHFEGCPNLKHIQIPSSVELGDAVKVNNSWQSVMPFNLRSITFPSSTRFIGLAACYNCTKLHSADLSRCHQLTQLSKSNYGVFERCHSLTSLKLPLCQNLKQTGNYFCHLTKLNSFDLSGCQNLQTINQYSFSQSPSTESTLTSVIFPPSVKSIHHYTFDYSNIFNPSLRTLIWKGRTSRPSVVNHGAPTTGISYRAFSNSQTLDDLVNAGTLQEIFVP